jgi:hypothetical protein
MGDGLVYYGKLPELDTDRRGDDKSPRIISWTHHMVKIV